MSILLCLNASFLIMSLFSTAGLIIGAQPPSWVAFVFLWLAVLGSIIVFSHQPGAPW